MRKIFSILLVIFFLFVPFVKTTAVDINNVDLNNLSDVTKKLEDLRREFESVKQATDTNQAEYDNLQKQLDGIKVQVGALENEIIKKEKEVKEGEKALSYQKDLLYERARSYYKNIEKNSFSLINLLVSDNLSESLKNFFYQKKIVDEDRKTIIKVVMYINDLEDKKESLVQEKKQLAAIKIEIDKQAEFLSGEISTAKVYQSELSSKISELTAQQQAILSQKTGTFQTSVGEVPLTDDHNSSPSFDPGFSPAFAAFSFGAPHFNGLSQYGAYGRAKTGQGTEDILRAYYGDVEIKKDYDQNANICVGNDSGSCENIPLETYAKRIYEMPGSWGDEGGMSALEAQAVAARSYALADMQRRGFICPTESCQVYKPENKGGKWEEAVNNTAGWVMMKNGKPLWSKYASTAGGYIDAYTDTASSGHSTPSFWDTQNGRDGWTSQAYEKISGSPWFYKAWYKLRSGDSCGRSHPWLNEEEMADVLNAWLVLQDNPTDDRVTPIGSCWGGNPYSMSELRDKANGLGGAVTSISGVSVQYSEGGYTANLIFNTNKGSIPIPGYVSGDEKGFYKTFNLRAPGRVHLKNGLFNIEKK